ncbi:MAG: hypothetical protein U0941_30010 [Planctomycetaceae bacterium]
MSRDLTAVETLALGKVIKDAAITKARGQVSEGSAHAVDITVRITGSLNIGHGTPASSGQTEETEDLKTFNACCALLRLLNVRKSRIVQALAQLKTLPADDEELKQLFDNAATTRPRVSRRWSSSAKAAAITTNLTVTLQEPPHESI